MLFRSQVEEIDNNCNIKIECWVTPSSQEIIDHKRVISQFEKNLKTKTWGIREDCGFSDYIIDLDLRDSGVKFGKNSYMKCEITLEKHKSSDLDVEKYLKLFNKWLESDKNFSFTSEKPL
jgi:hypothetical protein